MDAGNWDYLHWLDLGRPEALLNASNAHHFNELEEVNQHAAETFPSIEPVAHHQEGQPRDRLPSFSQRPLLDKMVDKIER
ncbi:hypothetical protein BV898_04407 [Hypsibius exemplaris]|uniref:Uncharacterized protein n=1 Tax=Hypsibius exemplaris TaxID=2072580 RepID=A0A1W0X315_HYPEX|nr:hypothetical protein BV898_04407 [Hypsibius exemplaris]